MQLTWFRRPSEGDPGTQNLCYDAVDLQVIRGHASATAVVTESRTLDFASLLEQIATLSGAMRGLGVLPAHRVVVLLDDPLDALLALLSCTRLGAVHVEASGREAIDEHRPTLVLTSRPIDFGWHVPAVCLVRGFAPVDPTRDVDWELALRAGRTDPAPCADLAPDSTAFVVDGEEVPLSQALTHDSWPARAVASLVAGGSIDLTREQQ